MDKPVADHWFGIAQAGDALLQVREIHIDPYLTGNMWVAEGRDCALLIDTGTGIVPLRATLTARLERSIKAVALNCFYDHAAGLYEFDERLAHEADSRAIEAPDGKTSVADEYVSDDMLRALPWPGYSTAGYAMRPAHLTRALRNGDRIDLGDRVFDVIHTPLPTPGSICLWEAATGSLFTSDVLFQGPEGFELVPRNREHLAMTVERLRVLPVKRVYPGHYEAFGRDTMDRLLDGLG
jgi:glyoxylase-like metal-dependent hydrolase (beta-lactamase superfamily II)